MQWAGQYQAGSRKPPAGRDRVRAELERTFEEVALSLLESVAAVWTRRGEPFQPQDLVSRCSARTCARSAIVWSGGLVVLLGEFGFSDGAARAALTRLVRRDLIARVARGGWCITGSRRAASGC